MNARRNASSMPSLARRSRTSKQIARMLAVQGGNRLSCVKIGKRNEPHFSKAEVVFDHRRDAAQFGLKDATAQDRRDLDLDLHTIGADQ